MDKSEGGEFYYPNELVEGSLEWQNASYKPTDSELQSIDLDFQYSSLHFIWFGSYIIYVYVIAIPWVGQ